MDDDGMLLNLTYAPTSYASSKHVSSLDEKSRVPLSKKVQESGKKLVKRAFVPQSEFTPISSLFKKNPDVPALPENSAVQGRCDHDLFTVDAFDQLPIHRHLVSNLQNTMKFSNLTKVQKLSLPVILASSDCMIKSVTGSGKTTCYAVPIVHSLMSIEPRISRSCGPYAVILLPTRELALQTFNFLQALCKSCVWVVPGLLVGGDNCKAEKGRLRKGMNIIVATPGRLLYHVQGTSCLDLSHVQFLVLDEADKLLDMGFEKSILSIIGSINEKSTVKRQSILLSATLSPNITNLAAVCMDEPKFIDASAEMEAPEKVVSVASDNDFVVPESLKQYFVVVPAKLRFITLMAFIARNALTSNACRKIIVFIATKQSVEFHATVFKDIVCPYVMQSHESDKDSVTKKVFKLHGDMTQQERFSMFKKFKRLPAGILFCTDVAARGVDLPMVDYIVQYTCPTEVQDYLHRVGRTARIGAAGKALLFLLPSEVKYKELLDRLSVAMDMLDSRTFLSALITNRKSKNVSQNDIEDAATRLQKEVEEKVLSNPELKKLSKSAYMSFLKGYATYPADLKHIFNVRSLHLGHIAKSFCLREAPKKLASSKEAKQSASKRKAQDLRSEAAKRMRLSGEQYVPDEILNGPRPGHDRAGKQVSGKSSKGKKRVRLRI